MGSSALVALLAATSNSGGSGAFSFVFLALMIVPAYFFLIRPQKRRARAQQQVQRAVAIGDEILTTSGMYGIVTAMDDEDLWIEVSEGTEIRIARGALMRVTQSVPVETDSDEMSSAPSTDGDAPVDDD